MDPNLIASLFANDPNTTTNTQPNPPAPQQPYAPPTIPAPNPPQSQNNTAPQFPTPAPSSPTPSTNNQLTPPHDNKYNAWNPYSNSINPYNAPQGPGHQSDSRYDSDSESDDDDYNQFPFPGMSVNLPGISINSNNNHGNIFGPINNGIDNSTMSGGWPNTTFVNNGRDWSSIPQSQWPASVRRDYQQGMAQGARAMSQAADLLNGLGLGMGIGMGMVMGTGMGGRRRR